MAGALGKGRIYGTTAQQRYVYATKFFCCHSIFRIPLWRHLAARLIRLGVVRGVGRHESPQRRENIGDPINKHRDKRDQTTK